MGLSQLQTFLVVGQRSLIVPLLARQVAQDAQGVRQTPGKVQRLLSLQRLIEEACGPRGVALNKSNLSAVSVGHTQELATRNIDTLEFVELRQRLIRPRGGPLVRATLQ